MGRHTCPTGHRWRQRKPTLIESSILAQNHAESTYPRL